MTLENTSDEELLIRKRQPVKSLLETVLEVKEAKVTTSFTMLKMYVRNRFKISDDTEQSMIAEMKSHGITCTTQANDYKFAW